MGTLRKRRLPVVTQTSALDCGAACLAIVLAYHGKDVPLEEIRSVAHVDRDGADGQSLLEAGEWFGLRGRGVQLEEVEDLSLVPRGTVLHWNFDHFVVFESMTGAGAVIVDPALGRRRVTHAELRRSLTGVAILFEPGSAFRPSSRRRSAWLVYWEHLAEQTGSLLRVIGTSILLQLFALATPLLTGLVVDRVVPRRDYELLWIAAGGLAMLVGFGFLSSMVRAHLLLELRTRLDAEITVRFLEHLVDLPYRFFLRRTTGDLMMRLASNSQIREMLTSSVLSGLLDGAFVSMYLVLLLVTHVELGMLVLGLGLARVLVFLATRRRQGELMSESLETQARCRGFQLQVLAGIETLKSMGAERRATERWTHLFVDELNVSLARGRLTALFDSLLYALELASPLLILGFGALEVMAGELTLGTMLAVSALAVGFLGPLSTLVRQAVQLQTMSSYLERIEDVLGNASEQESSERQPTRPLRGKIRLENVSYRYSAPAPLVVKDVSLTIEPGSLVAIVGPSGAGKSSLAHLLVGLFEPSAGRILFDEVDARHLDLRSLRRQLGIVPQDPAFFGMSLRENISLGNPELPLARVIEAARRAQIHADIAAMPMGYDTVLADRGASLSGGQRQRLALARALVHQPAILLLDEATNALDTVTEQAVHRELASMSNTRVVISHRLSTVAGADLILVMKGGEILEQGKHESLSARKGFYHRMVRAQSIGAGDA